MKLFALAGLALVTGAAFLASGTPTATASTYCSSQLKEEGSLLYGQVYDAKPIKKSPKHVKAILPKWVAGAKMYLHAEKGMTKEYLNRVATCHARTSDASEYTYARDPLRVEGKKDIRVYSAGDAFVISVTSEDKATGREIWKRAEELSRAVDVDLVGESESKKTGF